MSEQTNIATIRNRVRDTCITSCGNYPNLVATAEAERDKLQRSLEAGKKMTSSTVKIVCPHNIELECSGFVQCPSEKLNIIDVLPVQEVALSPFSQAARVAGQLKGLLGRINPLQR